MTDVDALPTQTTPRLEIEQDGLAQVVFDDPDRSMNVLSRAVMTRFDQVLDDLERAVAEGSVRAVLVRSAKPGSFIAGADVEEIVTVVNPEAGVEAARVGQELFARLSTLAAPTICAIDGVCLGGGTEIALACHFRVASDDERTRIGLPEVQLGILPGWGGTSRLPRLVGLQAALDMILTGKPVRASKARRIGLVDGVFPTTQFAERARAFALSADPRRQKGRKAPLLTRILDGTPPGRSLVLRTARKRVRSQTGGHYPAPLRILDVVGEGLRQSLSENLAAEARALGELVVTPECKNLLHVFHMREKARKGPWSDGGQAAPVRRLGILGAGVMGGGVAQLAAYKGIPARMKDIRHEAVASGLAHAKTLFDGAVKRRRLSRRKADSLMQQVSGGLDYNGFGLVDLVVEAVVERMDVKKAVLAETEAHTPPGAVLTSNTSSLSIAEMSEALTHPERFLGMHFFNPVHRMPLVEVVRGPATSESAVETVAAFAVQLGKVPVVTGDGPGFLVNRILGPYLNEAGHMLDEGLDAPAVDETWKRFGMPMGPFRLIDEVGIDVMRHAGEILYDALGDRLRPAPSLTALADSGRLGRKGGLGFYRHEGKKPVFDVQVYEDIGQSSARIKPDPEETAERLWLTMVNEATRVLAEGVTRTAADVDLAMIMGTGFPPFRGGLLKYADDEGLEAVVETLGRLARTYGPRFEPSDTLVDVARQGGTLYSAFPGPS